MRKHYLFPVCLGTASEGLASQTAQSVDCSQQACTQVSYGLQPWCPHCQRVLGIYLRPSPQHASSHISLAHKMILRLAALSDAFVGPHFKTSAERPSWHQSAASIRKASKGLSCLYLDALVLCCGQQGAEKGQWRLVVDNLLGFSASSYPLAEPSKPSPLVQGMFH